ncbi:MAG: L-aspartate oxidase [Ignavibacteria bacterium]|nr:MAG: L-aspartate oxidase [Ignavibacteria bacterium]KAF0160883.1 MAG: L-aspartate oxidase [Ignavibacteria bacterium]
MKNIYDYIIVGQGLAGLAAAFYASEFGSVAIISKENRKISNSYLAQGGVAAAISGNDSPLIHYNDTIKAGKGLCDDKAVKVLVKEGAEIIKEIIQLGMKFDSKDSELAVSLEGGHSKCRVLHAKGIATGKELVRFFSKLISERNNIYQFNNTLLLEVLTEKEFAKGVRLIDLKKKKVHNLLSNNIILATGGFTGIYQRTTNPNTTIGEGIVAAYNAGAYLENMEFVQFHPTALNKANIPALLLSEALRGDGAVIVDYNGKRVFENSLINELSPRDELSKAIFCNIIQNKKINIYLSLEKLDKKLITKKYCSIYISLKKFDTDITKQKIPISPAAHYSVGGIKTDLNGSSNVKGLYAIGEAASTGVHGANRLASNSLLECLVFAKRAVNHSRKQKVKKVFNHIEPIELIFAERNASKYYEVRKEIAKLLWENVGIIRNQKQMERCITVLNNLEKKYLGVQNEFYFLQTQNLIKLANLIVKAALVRKESRGCHYRSDYPNPKSKFRASSIQTKNIKLFYETK